MRGNCLELESASLDSKLLRTTNLNMLASSGRYDTGVYDR